MSYYYKYSYDYVIVSEYVIDIFYLNKFTYANLNIKIPIHMLEALQISKEEYIEAKKLLCLN